MYEGQPIKRQVSHREEKLVSGDLRGSSVRQRRIIFKCDSCKAALEDSKTENLELEIRREGQLNTQVQFVLESGSLIRSK